MRRRSGYGWLELIIGVLFVFLGIYSFIRPDTTLVGIVVIYGLIAIISGISDVVFFVKTERYTGFGPTIALISGVFSIMAGFMLLVYPNAGKWVMALLLPIWFIAHCISRLAHLHLIRIAAGRFYYYFTLVINIIGIVLGGMMVIYPTISLISAGLIIGIYLVLLGVDSIVRAASQIGSKR